MRSTSGCAGGRHSARSRLAARARRGAGLAAALACAAALWSPLAHAYSYLFTDTPTYALSSDGNGIAVVAPAVTRSGSPSGFIDTGVVLMLYAFATAPDLPTPPFALTALPPGKQLVSVPWMPVVPPATFPVGTPTFQYPGPDVLPAGSYYLVALLATSAGTISNLVVQDVHAFAGPVALDFQAADYPNVYRFVTDPATFPSPSLPKVRLVAPGIEFLCPSGALTTPCTGFSGATLELWAFPSPYTYPGREIHGPPALGYKLASGGAQVALDSTSHFYSLDSGMVAYTAPPAGRYHLVMLLTGQYGDPAAGGSEIIFDAYPLGTGTVDASAPAASPSPLVTVHEYYHAGMDHYFITASPTEIALCDAGTPPCSGWVATGVSFAAYDTTLAPTWSVPVCRFYNDHFAGKSSHFYAAPDDCATTQWAFPDWQLETADAFAIGLACNPFTTAIRRVYNNGMGGAPAHRYVDSDALRDTMVAKGWVDEGVVFCAPMPTTAP